MNTLLGLYLRMWLLRANPQDLPVSRTLTYLLGTLYLVLATVLAAIGHELLPSLTSSLVDIVVLVAIVHTALMLANVPERNDQTLSAMLGATLALMVVSTLLGILPESPMRLNLLWGVLGWYLVIFGHVLRQAVNLPVLLGAMIGFLYVMVTAGVSQWLLQSQVTGA